MNTTPQPQQRPLLALLILSLCLLFLSVNGFIGGYVMMSEANGAPFGMAVSDLANTPFSNFFLPGLATLVLWGVGSLVALVGLWLRPHWALLERLTAWTHEHWSWDLSILIGVGLMIWLLVQVIALPAIAPIQLILFVLALALVSLPWLTPIRTYYATR